MHPSGLAERELKIHEPLISGLSGKMLARKFAKVSRMFNGHIPPGHGINEFLIKIYFKGVKFTITKKAICFSLFLLMECVVL